MKLDQVSRAHRIVSLQIVVNELGRVHFLGDEDGAWCILRFRVRSACCRDRTLRRPSGSLHYVGYDNILILVVLIARIRRQINGSVQILYGIHGSRTRFGTALRNDEALYVYEALMALRRVWVTTRHLILLMINAAEHRRPLENT